MKQDERLYVLYLEEFLNRTPYYVVSKQPLLLWFMLWSVYTDMKASASLNLGIFTVRYFQWSLIKHFAMDLTWELQEIMVYIFRWVGQE